MVLSLPFNKRTCFVALCDEMAGETMTDASSDDLLANYKRAYDNRIGFGKRLALILVDFVRAYFDPACELEVTA